MTPLPQSFREVVVLKKRRRVRRSMLRTFLTIVGYALLVMVATPLLAFVMDRR